jgi:uncharacterized protein (TIGR02588 family)
MTEQSRRSHTTPNTPPLEWIAAAIGLILLIAVLTVIGREALRAGESPSPAIAVHATRIVASEGGYIVEFEAVNRSGGTGAAVEIEGVLGPADQPVETSTATLDYVAGHARAKGGLYFSHDPRTQPLALRALGYRTP